MVEYDGEFCRFRLDNHRIELAHRLGAFVFFKPRVREVGRIARAIRLVFQQAIPAASITGGSSVQKSPSFVGGLIVISIADAD